MSPDDLLKWGQLAADSALYAHLAGVLAGDARLLETVNRIENTPQPNVLLAGVQYLLMTGRPQALARYYPNLSDSPQSWNGLDEAFKEFVLEHEHELIAIGRSRRTQTNECRRCVALLPAIWETGLTRFHLVDLGTSAGLNLVADKYRYRWDDLRWGGDSSIVLETELHGLAPSPRPIEVLTRSGLDLNPIDLAEPDERLWLEALIWPEHEDRRRRLREAIELVRRSEIVLVAGDALATLGPTLSGLPDDEPVVVMHSFALNQLTLPQREQIDRILAEERRSRPVSRVSMEILDWGETAARLTIDDGLGPREIGRAHPHGEWLELYALP